MRKFKNELSAYENSLKRHYLQRAMELSISSLELAVEDLTAYLDEFKSTSSNEDKARIAGWTIHYLSSNILMNLYIGEIANALALMSREDE